MSGAASAESESSAETLPAYVLSGGRSRRFGSDKARALLDGSPLIVRVAQRLRSLGTGGVRVSAVTAVADRPDRYADMGLPTIADDEPDLGPVGGLRTALSHAGCGWIVLASCDLLEVRDAWLAQLLAARGAAGAVCFRGERWQPFPGLYHVDLLAAVDAYLGRGSRSVQRLLDEVHATAVPLPPDWPAVVQANTAADLARYRRQDERGDTEPPRRP